MRQQAGSAPRIARLAKSSLIPAGTGPRRSGMTWHSGNLEFVSLRVEPPREECALTTKYRLLLEPAHELQPQRWREFAAKAPFDSLVDRSQPKHRILSLSTHRVTPHALTCAGGLLAALPAREKATAAGHAGETGDGFIRTNSTQRIRKRIIRTD